ncbi:ARMT1-like domain-containing protein [Desulfococcaceae bacterium OttesenSCG-928-F15]|nr:ARMT1-like domain-containing protein [Desulfococcaceae bacterium OttesenSCG-928-F15]
MDTTEVKEQKAKQDAWEAAFFIENHLDHTAYPDEVAHPEQVSFMVYLQPGERYYPCAEGMFRTLTQKENIVDLDYRYQKVFSGILHLVDSILTDPEKKLFLKCLLEIKFRHETRDRLMIPSRLEKRLFQIFLNQTGISDPFFAVKISRNERAAAILASEAFKKAFDFMDSAETCSLAPTSLGGIRSELDEMEMKRLLLLSGASELWLEKEALVSEDDFHGIFQRPLTGDTEAFFNSVGILGKERGRPKKILWLGDEAGEILFDLKIISFLIRMGHKVVLSLKDKSFFTKVDFSDILDDAILHEALEGDRILSDLSVSKNALVDILRREKNLVVISDGTRENINLLLASTTFARVFKEMDFVVARGEDQRRRLFDNPFQFTRPIFSLTSGENGAVRIALKPAHPDMIRFSHIDLEKKAKEIICAMKEASGKGMAVMFYSGIIGSIPGKIDEAKKLMGVIIGHLRETLAETFIINPSQHYEKGMDADDLMYMWEIVQRSGYINIWRFQTYDDIALAFSLMGQKVPPEWVGKDATYSTGCTKEMHIAQDVQKKNPEMQISGPPPEKFMRRKDYGVGKMYDKILG